MRDVMRVVCIPVEGHIVRSPWQFQPSNNNALVSIVKCTQRRGTQRQALVSINVWGFPELDQNHDEGLLLRGTGAVHGVEDGQE